MYSDTKVISFDVKTADLAAVIADEADIFSLIIPAGCEVNIEAFYVDVRLASDGADILELVDGSDNVLAQVSLQTTGLKTGVDSSSAAITYPVRLAPQSASALSKIKLKLEGATDATCEFTAQIHISGLDNQ